MEGINHQSNPFYKQIFINGFTYINEYAQNKAIKNTQCLVNSEILKRKYNRINPDVKEVRTTTLSRSDFHKRTNTCLNPECINLLFVGRIEKDKGIEELSEAFIRLRQNGFPVVLHLVGWDTIEAQKYYAALVKEVNATNAVVYHGYKTGIELLKLYRQADIFVLPSHHEGFPRVIWEAMANSLPVIATSVGGIPFNLKSEIDAVLIPPQNCDALYCAMVRIINDTQLRQTIIKNGFEHVQDYTMDIQVKKIITAINE
jgi:glycosyltransferase involved in cell wall biosynthesis